jgi:hypothetical protein
MRTHFYALRFSAAALLTGIALTSAGCTKTDDGTILMAGPASSMYLGEGLLYPKRETYRPTTRTAFPPQPRTGRKGPAVSLRAPRVEPMRVGVKTPFKAAPGDKQLTCANVAGADGRIKVVCQ